jgi:hypothetical protein
MLLPAQYAPHATPTAPQTFQEQRRHFAITRCVSFKTADRTEAVTAPSGSPMRSPGRADPGNENANVNNSTGISRAMICIGSQYQTTCATISERAGKVPSACGQA